MAMGGANVPFGKAIVSEISVEAFLVVRFIIASILLALLVPFEPGPRLSSLSLRHWGGLVALALLGSVLFTVFLLMGVQRTTATDAGIITATLPAVIVAASALLGERPRTGEVGMVALAVLGVGLIQASAAGTGGQQSFAGNVLVGVAVLCEASFVLVSRTMSALVRPVRLSFGVSVICLVACLPLLASPTVWFDPRSLSWETWILIGWYTVTASILSTVLWYMGVSLVPGWVAGLATTALPLTALAVSAAYLGETISQAQMAGAALVILSLCLGSLAQRRRRTG